MLNINNFRTILLKSKKKKEFSSFSEIQLNTIYKNNSARELTKRNYLSNNYIFDFLKIKDSEARLTLDHIGDELLLNNDKLISNLKIEPNFFDENLFLNKTVNEIKPKTPLNKSSNNKHLNLSSIQLKKNHKKIPFHIKLKNINQFINKPSKNKNSHSFNKSESTKHIKSKSSSFNSKIIRNKNFNFPKNIKNIDKSYFDLENIFGEKFELSNNLFQQMNDLDKKNCICYLLNFIKELKRNNDILKKNNNLLKTENEEKSKNIKYLNEEIKLYKRERKKSLNNTTPKRNNNYKKSISPNLKAIKLNNSKTLSSNNISKTKKIISKKPKKK